jgi:hypothetical protein
MVSFTGNQVNVLPKFLRRMVRKNSKMYREKGRPRLANHQR